MEIKIKSLLEDEQEKEDELQKNISLGLQAVTLMEINVCPKCDKPIRYRSTDSKHPENIGLWKCFNCKEWFEQVSRRPRNQKYWGNHRAHEKDKEIITDKNLIKKSEFLEQLKKIDNIQSKSGRKIGGNRARKYKAYLSFLYLTGARVQEIIGYKIYKEDHIDWYYKPIMKSQISIIQKDLDKFLKVANMPIFKRKMLKGVVPTRNCVIYFKHDKPFIEYILDYIKHNRIYEGMPLFHSPRTSYLDRDSKYESLSPAQCNNICKNITYPIDNSDPENNERREAFNHYFRHLRLSHLAKYYGFNDTKLRNFIGWADNKMAGKYAHLGEEEMIDALTTSNYTGETFD